MVNIWIKAASLLAVFALSTSCMPSYNSIAVSKPLKGFTKKAQTPEETVNPEQDAKATLESRQAGLDAQIARLEEELVAVEETMGTEVRDVKRLLDEKENERFGKALERENKIATLNKRTSEMNDLTILRNNLAGQQAQLSRQLNDLRYQLNVCLSTPPSQ